MQYAGQIRSLLGNKIFDRSRSIDNNYRFYERLLFPDFITSLYKKKTKLTTVAVFQGENS